MQQSDTYPDSYPDVILDALETGTQSEKVSPKQITLMQEFDKSLIVSGIFNHVLRPGSAFPDFTLANQRGDDVTLTNLLDLGPLVVSFFRGSWCPYCNFELQALQQHLPQFEGSGATVIAISPQTIKANKETYLQNRLRFDLLSDPGNGCANKLGIVFQLGDRLKAMVQQLFDVNLLRSNGEDSWRLPVSARFVVDTDSTIVASDIYVNFGRRPNPLETLAIVKAITRRIAIPPPKSAIYDH